MVGTSGKYFERPSLIAPMIRIAPVCTCANAWFADRKVEPLRALVLHPAEGWQGHLAYDPREHEAPYAVFYCPACAEREFGDCLDRPERPEGWPR
jgi:hypothetical protein